MQCATVNCAYATHTTSDATENLEIPFMSISTELYHKNSMIDHKVDQFAKENGHSN